MSIIKKFFCWLRGTDLEALKNISRNADFERGRAWAFDELENGATVEWIESQLDGRNPRAFDHGARSALVPSASSGESIV